MEPSIYRFRSMDALLDRFHELENQELYVASPSEMNDPLEGYKDLFWKGDDIAWRSLFRHYLLCMMQAILRTLEQVPGYEVTSETLPVGMIDNDLHPGLRKVFDALCEKFFNDPELAPLTNLLAQRNARMFTSEFLSLLQFINPRIFRIVCTTLQPETPIHPIDAGLRGRADSPLRLKESFAAFESVAASRQSSPEIVEAITSKMVSALAQTVFILNYNKPNEQHDAIWIIASAFPEIYLNALEKLLYFDWYTACFVADPSQAAMWGYYGDSHRGACLKFKKSALSSGEPALTLRHLVGVRGASGNLPPVYRFEPLQLYEVRYEDRYAEVDFFRSLGRLTHRQLVFWFQGANGRHSATGLSLLQESNEWRQSYWESFHRAVTTKLKDWRHEREFRIALQSSADLSDPAQRKLQYRFEDLEGVIFGMKASLQHKMAVMRIIQDKCRKTGRNDFEIYQANYSRQTGRVDSAKWDLVKPI
jgi:hypothetical protein